MIQPTMILITAGNDVTFIPSAFGRKYSEATTMIAREDRSADGTLRRDITASKKTITLSYSYMDNAELERWDTFYSKHSGDEINMEIRKFIDGMHRNDKYTVLMKAFSKTRVSNVFGGLWESVTIEFEEV